MSQYDNYELGYAANAAESAAAERAAFIRRVYGHLAGGILALIGLVAVAVNTFSIQDVGRMFTASPWTPLIIMVLFIGASFVAQSWAQSRSSPALQYIGFALYIGVWALMFTPLIMIMAYTDGQRGGDPFATIKQAGILTATLFGGLTTVVFMTRKDFSFLGSILAIASWVALGVIVASLLFGFTLGLLFSAFMVALVCGSILYNTSNVMRHYPTDMHVAAALELFADVAMLFWYVARILMATRD